MSFSFSVCVVAVVEEEEGREDIVVDRLGVASAGRRAGALAGCAVCVRESVCVCASICVSV